MLRGLRETIQTIRAKDPAAKSAFEILLLYPSIHVMAFHRVAHALYKAKIPFVPRFLSQIARFLTGIEIHPGARIGRRFFIDHGMGVVIGETAVIGDDVLLYHGVTLGGTGKVTGKRHPTLCDHVVVGAGAKILGNIVVGERSRVGAGSVVLHDVPAQATVVGIPGRITFIKGQPTEMLPDPEAQAIKALATRVYQLEEAIQRHQTVRQSGRTIPEVDEFLNGAGI